MAVTRQPGSFGRSEFQTGLCDFCGDCGTCERRPPTRQRDAGRILCF